MTLRAIQEQNLIDDPLRLLRGLRFMAEQNLSLDPEAATWIQRHRHRLPEVAPERILSELQRLATNLGIEQQSIDTAMDADSPKQAMVELITAAEEAEDEDVLEGHEDVDAEHRQEPPRELRPLQKPLETTRRGA